jgi:hypothetical protein
MPATATERTRFRRKLAAPDFDEDEVNDIFDEMASTYADYSRDVVFAAALVEGVDNLLLEASKRTNYSAGASSESHSDVFRALYKMREKFEAKLTDTIESESVAVRFGSLKKHPSRKRELPGDYRA